MQLRCWLIQLINSVVFTILLSICSPSTNLFPFVWIPKSPSPSPFLNKYSYKECYQNDSNINAPSPEQVAVSCRIETIRKEENYQKGLRLLCFLLIILTQFFRKTSGQNTNNDRWRGRTKSTSTITTAAAGISAFQRTSWLYFGCSGGERKLHLLLPIYWMSLKKKRTENLV